MIGDEITPRRAFILWKQRLAAGETYSVRICIAPPDRENEAVAAALRGTDALTDLTAAGGFPVISLNDEAMLVLDGCDGITTVTEVEQYYCRQFGVEHGAARVHIAECLESLSAAGAVDLDWCPLDGRKGQCS